MVGSIVTGEFSITFIFGFMIGLIVVSALLSAPSLIILLFVSELNRQETAAIKFRRMVLTHVLVYIITMVIGNLYFYQNMRSYDVSWDTTLKRMLFFSEITTGYAVTAVIVWIVMFRKDWLVNKETESQSQTIH